jgi:hypothetical protein
MDFSFFIIVRLFNSACFVTHGPITGVKLPRRTDRDGLPYAIGKRDHLNKELGIR